MAQFYQPYRPQYVSYSSTQATEPASSVIYDRNTGESYIKGRFLGKGGFAKVYEFTNVATNETTAGKVVSKSSLDSKTRKKLMTEIQIHRSLSHPNIVRFEKHFEDASSVYLCLEMCENKSCMELMENRKRLTEPEALYYMRQIVDATSYMHSHYVIHRDLKLGNMFLNHNMEIKLGDFGLATTLEHYGERKKTVCGTPNYIAPEIIDNRSGRGHSFEVDIWSIGVILYTFLVGRPPFETQNIQTTYELIKSNCYSFPDHIYISENAKSLIRSLLHKTPELRPNIQDICKHPFFTESRCPTYMPAWTMARAPAPEELSYSPRKTARSENKENVIESVDKIVMSSFDSVAPAPAASAAATGPAPNSDAALQATHAHLTTLLSTIAAKSAAGVTEYPPAQAVGSANAWVVKWVDYSNKWGMGYQLSDGTFGVYFNDATKIAQSIFGSVIEYYSPPSNGGVIDDRTTIDSTRYPESMKKKVTLLDYFKNYLTEHLGGDNQDIEARGPVEKMTYVSKWYRTKDAIVFRLTNGVVQVNFFDGTRLVLNPGQSTVQYNATSGTASTYNLADLVVSPVAELVNRVKFASDFIPLLLQQQPTAAAV